MIVHEDLEYADDIGLLFSKHHGAQQMAECFNKSAKALKVSSKKTQVRWTNTRVIEAVMNDERRINDIEEFTYLGTDVITTGYYDREINTWISKASRAFAIQKRVLEPPISINTCSFLPTVE